jgi:hypothetical protein
VSAVTADTPTRLPVGVLDDALDLAESLALVAGDEAAVLDVIARTARELPTYEHAAALAVCALAFTYARCVVMTDPPSTTPTPKENTP